MEQNLQSLVDTIPQFKGKNYTLAKLAGEASSRVYYRITFESGQTLIVMKLPEGYASISEEVTKTSKKFDDIPFVNVQKYLAGLGLPVPQIFGFDKDAGLMLLADFGDVSLEKAIGHTNEAGVIGVYKKAIDLLLKMQEQTRRNPSDDCVAYSRKFDADLLFWEFCHFLEYGIEDRFQLKINPDHKARMEALGKKLCGEIVSMPTGFVHRDYQSRNIIVLNGELKLIDFQDALVGPAIYDLVALLRDSYIDLNPAQVDKLVDYYASTLFKNHPYEKNPSRIKSDFHRITIQRKLKDTGRFQYIATVKKNPGFLPNVPRSIGFVVNALKNWSDGEELKNLIANYVPEFKA